MEELIKNAKLNVPQSLVMRQLGHRLNEALKHFESQGLSEEALKKKIEELRVQLVPVVEREVRIYLILTQIAKVENITTATEDESLPAKVVEFLLKEAQWTEA